MLLSHAGLDTQPSSLVDSVYVPGKQGSFATELKATARKHGRLPYEIEPSLQALARALADGYPVLILQNLGLGFAPKWHFAVTIGFDRKDNAFILRTGPDRRLEMSTPKFDRRWRLGDYWAIILLGPDDFPAWLRQREYERQFALMEKTWGGYLEEIYRRMQARWLDSTMAMLGLGNIAYDAGELDDAAGYYGKTLAIEPEHIAALHNLAQVRFDRGDHAAALQLVCRAKDLARNHPLEAHVNDLESKLQQVKPEYSCPKTR